MGSESVGLAPFTSTDVHCDLAFSQLRPAENRQVRTIEALADDPVGTRVQKAWLDLKVIQCGYCQSGQIMAAASLLMQTPHPSDVQIDFAMSGNIRCGTYPRIRAAIHEAARL